MNWKEIKNIAVVGLSDKPERASNRVAKYLQEQGYKVIPVNPTAANILGETSYPSVAEIPKEIVVDVVDVFRKSTVVPEIAEQAIDRGASVLWLQEGVINNDAAKKAEAAGMEVIMDKCIMKEHRKDVG
ncbi:CoA-binding protein [Metallumcola ferriviriculae]|uniref:CoA-binding protein n=1 Tax=Metallumcola ferriviriculae TaxID=3039180 RepID=A0AAU0UIS7_9FIRM|nr:CoA-binding protein [Desulfitibacteraceae bacterium MK1]